MTDIQDASPMDEEGAAGAFVGRVFASLMVLVVLAAMAAALIGLAYISKHSRSGATPSPAGQSAGAALPYPAGGPR